MEWMYAWYLARLFLPISRRPSFLDFVDRTSVSLLTPSVVENSAWISPKKLTSGSLVAPNVGRFTSIDNTRWLGQVLWCLERNLIFIGLLNILCWLSSTLWNLVIWIDSVDCIIRPWKGICLSSGVVAWIRCFVWYLGFIFIPGSYRLREIVNGLILWTEESEDSRYPFNATGPMSCWILSLGLAGRSINQIQACMERNRAHWNTAALVDV